MKKIYLLLGLLLSLTLQIKAQTYSSTSTYTPGGTLVMGEVLTSGEYTSGEIASSAATTASAHPLATILGPATRTYNCHGYAWCMTDGGSTMWINYGGGNVDAYFTNPGGGYSEISSSDMAEKIHYYVGDHSAVMWWYSGVYESKWGSLELMEHDPADVPSIYYSSDTKYYVYGDLNVYGAEEVGCGNTSYAVGYCPWGWSVAWTVSGNIAIVGSNTGTSVNVVSTGSGGGTITATYTHSYGTEVFSKDVTSSSCFNRLVAYPNPGDSEMALELSSEIIFTSNNQQPKPLAIPRDVKIFDQRGQVMFSGKMDKTKTSINTTSIPNGNYFLHVANGKDIIKKQIIINHK